MRNSSLIVSTVIVAAGLFLLAPFSTAFGKGVSLITKEELKPILNDEGLVIIDVRSGRDWRSSEFKIPGAVRGDPRRFSDWEKDYSKGQTLVLYCA
jgi:hypothetical protein